MSSNPHCGKAVLTLWKTEKNKTDTKRERERERETERQRAARGGGAEGGGSGGVGDKVKMCRKQNLAQRMEAETSMSTNHPQDRANVSRHGKQKQTLKKSKQKRKRRRRQKEMRGGGGGGGVAGQAGKRHAASRRTKKQMCPEIAIAAQPLKPAMLIVCLWKTMFLRQTLRRQEIK